MQRLFYLDWRKVQNSRAPDECVWAGGGGGG